MSSDAAVYLVGHFFKANPAAGANEAATFLLNTALAMVVKRLQGETPAGQTCEIESVADLAALPQGKIGRRAVHDDISVAVIRFIAGANEPRSPDGVSLVLPFQSGWIRPCTL
jgi:hypothetical protein